MARLPLRARLSLLVAGTTLPLILFAAGLVYLKYERDRAAAADRVLETVKGIQLVLDSELQGMTLSLEVLGNSRALQNEDLDGFRNNAEAFLRRYPTSAISLASRDGTQILNTGLPRGKQAPKRTNMSGIEAVFRTGQPAYSDCSSARSPSSASSR